MKKLRVNFVGILFAVLSLVFTACNSMLAGGETGTVRVVIGGGASARSINPSNGLPVFDDTNTKITVTDEDGNQLAQGTTSVTLKVGINRKITVEATMTTPIGIWRGSVEHTVTAGTNTVAVKLSKAPKGFANLLVSITGKHHSGSNIVSLSTQNGKKLLDGILIGKKPVTARDKIGRIYVLYEDASSTPTRHLKRFDVEGNEDTPISFANSTWASILSNTCIDSAVDVKTDTLFLAMSTPTGKVIYYTNKENGFVPSTAVNITTIDSAILNIHALAVYNNMVYLVVTRTTTPSFCLMAYEAVFSGSTLTLTHKATQALSKLRTDSAFDNTHTNCTGLFADESGVYCLLAENAIQWASESYAVGTLIRYDYSGGTLTKKTEQGLNPAASGSDRPIPFDDQYFFYPTGFIGSDENNIYIADDGFGIQYKNENWHIMNNRNRIAAFNRKTDSLSFSEAGVTWYEQKPEYKLPNTKILLWGKFYGSIKYWTSADGTEAFSPSNKLFESASGKDPTDIFCYDQDGNLYILWKESFGYNVRRFALKEDGSYDTQGVDLNNSLGSQPISAIAVDISGGQNYLYYTYEDGPNKHIQRYRWNGSSFSTATQDSMYGVHISSTSNKIFFTALAANKDGVFVGVKETYKEGSINKYRLKVIKYEKTGRPANKDSETTLVDNAVSYTDVADPPNPIPDPNPGSSPDSPCNQYQETINGLQIANGMLYGISSKLHRKWLLNAAHMYSPDVFKHSSILYTIGTTAETLPNRPLATKEKPVDDTNKVGYGFYRFIAVKYDEAERIRLIIASDSAWGKNGKGSPPPADGNNTDNIVEFNLKDMLFGEVKQSENVFSKTFNDSGFTWE